MSEARQGTVILKDWMMCPDGQTYLAITGTVTVVEAAEAIGFKTSRTESNFAAKITGEKEEVFVLGCQIRSFFFGKWDNQKTAFVVK